MNAVDTMISLYSDTSSSPTAAMRQAIAQAEVGDEQIAVHSAKNLHWQGVGKLKPGYNILSKEAAEKWLTNKHVREATAEEVATYYGKA